MKVCPRCNKEYEFLSKDHIIPRWFANRLSNLGVKIPRFAWKRVQMICLPCNQAKGGVLEWRDPYVRAYVALLINVLVDKLKETEVDPS